MKRINALLAIVLCAVVFTLVLHPVSAETENNEAVELTKAVDIFKDVETPVSYEVMLDIDTPENASTKIRNASCEYVGGNGRVVHVDAKFLLINRETKDDEWAQLAEIFEKTVLGYLESKGEGSAHQLADQLMNLLYAERGKASSGAQGGESLWADTSIALTSLNVTVPYYIDLANGTSGNSVRRLQQKLITLGYLTGEADGHFGPMTKKAVEELEQYVRWLEQDAIDAAMAAMPAPAKAPESTVAPEQADVSNGETPTETQTPAEISKPQPTTEIDGIADIKLQALLFHPDFPVTRGDMSAEDSGDAVVRLQRRLMALGYLTGDADGILGGNSQRGVRLFQHYNGLEETGVADMATQRLLFSAEAKAPDFPLMTVGSSGDAVKTLQKRLLELGFMTSAGVDGDFGNSTKAGVENLQSYMREREKAALIVKTVAPAPAAEDADATAPEKQAQVSIDESLLTVQVNGIADPLLLEEFYSASFPALPGALKEGDSNAEVMRLQRRLYSLEYLFTSADGVYGANTANAVKKFQERNNLTQTGTADEQTLAVMFSDKALKALKPYVLKVSVADQRVYAYGLDSNNEHTVLVRTMKCSTGLKATPTITGTFQSTTGPGARWHYFKKFKCWAQYAYYIKGDYLFHSVLYQQKNGPVTRSSVNNLGRRASHGCVRLAVEDAKWIYTNCPPQTKVIVS